MKITYTGRQVELAPAQLRKVGALFNKVGKLLDGKGEREAHVVVSLERHLHRVEVTMNYQNHPLVGLSSNADLFTAIHGAVQKLEKQAIKVRAKWRDSKRAPRKQLEASPAPAPRMDGEKRREVFRVSHPGAHKPMTLDEALLEMERGHDYLVYRDSENDRVSVLVRRRDGNFDLVEA